MGKHIGLEVDKFGFRRGKSTVVMIEQVTRIVHQVKTGPSHKQIGAVFQFRYRLKHLKH